ncbi:MAG TPA: thiamine phosphate synthase, partial [Gemmataceae bacterium]
AIRYSAYTLERAIMLGLAARDRLRDARLYVLLSSAQCGLGLERVIERAAAGGANVFQLREKQLSDRDLLATAKNVRRWTRQADALFIVNDRPDIARFAEADGVHLGQDDVPVKEARAILGPDALIGISTHSLDQVRQAILDGADYLGIGPTFPSPTKAFAAFPGLEFVREASRETSLPLFALGGIESANVAAVAAAGARRIAVSSCLALADDPEAVARALRTALE